MAEFKTEVLLDLLDIHVVCVYCIALWFCCSVHSENCLKFNNIISVATIHKTYIITMISLKEKQIYSYL